MRIVPLHWTGNYAAMRMEVYGCKTIGYGADEEGEISINHETFFTKWVTI